MRAPIKLLGAAIVASLAFGTGVAQADVFVTATADKQKQVTVFKTINIFKTVNAFATVNTINDATSEQDIFSNQRNQWNYAEDEGSIARNDIIGSFDNASGEQATIQNNGFNNNNLNTDSLSYANSAQGLGVFSDAEVNMEQINGLTEDPPEGPLPDDFDARGVNVFEVIEGATYDNNIDASFNGAAGVAKTIQENGSNNNNFNGVAIALGDFTTFALDEVNAGQFNNFNFADVRNLNRSNTINASFVGYNGIVATIQNNGSNSNNANSSAISASLTNAQAPGTPPVGNFGGAVTP